MLGNIAFLTLGFFLGRRMAARQIAEQAVADGFSIGVEAAERALPAGAPNEGAPPQGAMAGTFYVPPHVALWAQNRMVDAVRRAERSSVWFPIAPPP